MQKIENTDQLDRGSSSHSFAMKDVHHEASWLALSNEVRQQGAHAPTCTVTECGEFIERRFSSFGSTLHVHVRDECGRLSVEMSLMENVKQKRCYLAFDYDTELTSLAETDKYKTYVLPDGNVTTVGADMRGSVVPTKSHW